MADAGLRAEDHREQIADRVVSLKPRAEHIAVTQAFQRAVQAVDISVEHA